MTAGWVAGTVRAKAMARRALGAEAAREIAASRSLRQAQRMLQPTPYRDAADTDLTLAMAQHVIAATVLWELRVLAGWLPRDGVGLLRLLAGWFEIANVDELLQAQAGLPSGPQFQLGALATAWPRLSEARGTAELRRVLAASVWGDPGGDTSRDIRLAMRARWAARVALSGDRARTWANAAAALLRPPGSPDPPAGHSRANRRPSAAARLTGRDRPSASVAGGPAAQPWDALPWDVRPWEAEAGWWRGVAEEGGVLLRSGTMDSGPVLGAVAVLAADAWRVRAALACAARGGEALEAYDALA